jgi:hypothetical protein
LRDQIKKAEMGTACSTYGGEKRCIQGFSGKGDHLKDPGLDGRIILQQMFEKWFGRAWTGSIWLRTGRGLL